MSYRERKSLVRAWGVFLRGLKKEGGEETPRETHDFGIEMRGDE